MVDKMFQSKGRIHGAIKKGTKNIVELYLVGHRRIHWLPGRFVIRRRPVGVIVEFSIGRLHSKYPWSGGKSAGHAMFTVSVSFGCSVVRILSAANTKANKWQFDHDINLTFIDLTAKQNTKYKIKKIIAILEDASYF